MLRHLVAELPRWPTTLGQSRALQERQIRRLVDHAWRSVPFYRRLWEEAGFRPGDLRSREDLGRIPLTDRRQWQDGGDELLARGARRGRLVAARSSGSSGVPITVMRTRAEAWVHGFVHWRMYRALGNRVTDRRVSIGILRGGGRKWYRRLGLFPMEMLDVRRPVPAIVESLRRARPDILIACSSVASLVADELAADGGPAVRPRLVVTWGDTTTPELEATIGRVFAAPVVDFYGSHEARMIALQCRATGLYHLYENQTAVEVLRDGEPAREGEEGEVVVTALWSYAMPFIRYRQGDLVTLGPTPCPCGAPVRTLVSIEGRILDRIPVPGGGALHPYAVIRPIIERVPWVRRFQFVQESPRVLRLLLVATGPLSAGDLAAAASAAGAALEGRMELRAEAVPEIPPSPTGKFYPYLSLERQEGWRLAGLGGG